MARTISTFRHVRARLRLVREPGWRAAWVEAVVPGAARLRLQAYAELDEGEPLSVVCHGDRTLLRFEARVLAQAGQEIALGIVSPMAFEPSPEPVRLCVDGVAGTLWDDASAATFVATDASLASVGGLATRAFAPGESLGAALGTPLGGFEARVEVANCRPDPSDPSTFRLGLLIADASRLDRALWSRMVAERAAD